jgi:hypothetical protein
VQGTIESGNLTSSDLEIGSEGNGGLDWQVCAIQFDQLGIPQGAVITSAKLTLQVDNSGNPGTSNDFTVIAEDIDDAAGFTIDASDITNRARTDAEASWVLAAGPAVGTRIDSPDLTDLIQEVVDRAGWSENNRLTLMVYPQVYLDLANPSTGGTTTVQEIEFEAGPGSDAPTLTVEYVSTEPSSRATVVTITLDVNDETNPTPVTDSMTIDVYDTACMAARFGADLAKDNPGDFNGDCDTTLADFAEMAEKWLYETGLDEPFEILP